MEIAAIADQAKDILARMKMSIDRYAAKDNNSKSVVAERYNQLAILLRYIKASESLIISIEQERRSAFSDGLNEGERRAEARTEFGGYASMREWRFFDKETLREQIISQAKAKWHDHY